MKAEKNLSRIPTWRLWLWWFATFFYNGSDHRKAIGAEITRRGPAVVKRDGGFPDDRK